MKYSVVTSDKLKHNKDLRFEAEFWIQSSSRNGYKGEDIIDFVQYGTSKELNEQSKGFPILRLNEFENCFIMEPQKYCNLIDYNTYCKLKLEKNDVLICRTNGNPNYVGKAAIVTNSVEYAYASYLFKIRPKQKLINASTLTIYLNSKYGRNEINKYSMVGNQSNFSPAKFKEIIIPQLSTKIQEAIEKIVYEADSFNKDSKKIYCQAGELLLRELGILNWQPKHALYSIKNYSEVEKSNRFDAEYFQPKYDEIIEIIKSYSKGYTNLGKLGFFTNGSFIPDIFYTEKGEKAYIRIKELSLNKPIDKNDVIYINKNFIENNETKVIENDYVIATIGNTIGKVNLIDNDFANSYISNNTTRYRLKNPNNFPYYLEILLRSKVVQLQIEKEYTQTAQPKISNSSLEKITIPNIKNEIKQQINEYCKKSNDYYYKSKQLLEIAKRGVELAIEENEEVATSWIAEQLSKIGVEL